MVRRGPKHGADVWRQTFQTRTQETFMNRVTPSTGFIAAATTVRPSALVGRVVGGWVVAALFMGSTLLTPLYDLYRTAFHLSVAELGLLYAVYVLGNLAALLFLGRLSDQIGRRPVVLGGLALAALSAGLFLAAGSPPLLFAGRIVSGLAVGVGSGAATAWIAESTPKDRRAEAAATMTTFNFAGLAFGPIVAGVLAQYAPWPQRLPFGVYLVLLAVTALMAMRPKETVRRDAGAAIDLRPRLGVPAKARLAFIAPATAGFTAMAVVGFYAALGPGLVAQALHLHNRALSNLVVALLFVIAAVVIVASKRLGARPAMLAGLILTPAGLGLLAAAQALASAPLMLAGTAVCGAATAASYRGGLASASALAPPERRSEVASSYFVCCFLGNALPIMGVAALSQTVGAGLADRIFAGVLTALTLGAVACNLMFGGPRTAKR
jgi:MFS family permease